MDPEFKKLQSIQIKQAYEFGSILTKESDRGCALFAAAFLDQALLEYLTNRLVASKGKTRDSFYNGTGPLATFSARINMAYFLGGISAPTKSDLNIIRKIRNEFAHSVEVNSFNEKTIADKCKSLKRSYHESDVEPRMHFTAASYGLLGAINGATLMTKNENEKPCDAPTKETKKEFKKIFHPDSE